MLTAGGERYGQRLAFHSVRDDPGGTVILVEQIFPSLQYVAVCQHDRARNITGIGKLDIAAHADIHHTRGRRLQRRRPCKGHCPDMKRHRRYNIDLGVALCPRLRDGELFSMHRISAGGLEPIYSPLDRFLHGGRARNAAADLIGQHP